VWLLARDAGPNAIPPAAAASLGANVQSTPLRLAAACALPGAASVTTHTGLAPTFAGGSPAVATTALTAAAVTFSLSTPGTVHFVMVAGDAASLTAPSALQIAAGTDAAGGDAAFTGRVTVGSSAPVTTLAQGLPLVSRRGSNFTVFAFADGGVEDAALASDVATLSISLPHLLPPQWLALAIVDVANNATAGVTQFSVTVQLDEPARVFYVVLPAAAVAPSARQVAAGTGAGGMAPAAAGFVDAADAAVAVTFVHGGAGSSGALLDEAAYVLYAVAQDAAAPPNLQPTVSAVPFTTPAGSAPLFLSGPRLERAAADAAGGASFTLVAALRSAGTLLYMVTPGAPGEDPTRAQLAAGGSYVAAGNGASVTPSAAGALPLLPGALSRTLLQLASLPGAVFVGTTSSDGALLGDGDVARDNRTAVTKLAPAALSVGAAAPAAAGFALRIALSAPGVASYVVLRRGAAVPSAAHVLSGTDAAGRAPGDPLSSFPPGASSDVSAALNATAASLSVLSADIAGIAPRTRVDVYVVTQHDAAGDVDADGGTYGEATRGAPTRVSLAAPPVAPPAFLAGFPAVADMLSPSRVALSVALDDAPSSACALALASGATAPTAADVLFSGSCVLIPSAGVERTLTLTGLSASAEYDVYVAADAVMPTPGWEALDPAPPALLSFKAPPAAPALASLSVTLPDGTPLPMLPADASSGATFFALVDELPSSVSALNISAASDAAQMRVAFAADARSGTTASAWGGALATQWPLLAGANTAQLSLSAGIARDAPSQTFKLYARRAAAAPDADDVALSSVWVTLPDGSSLNASCAAGQAWPAVCTTAACARGCGDAAGVIVLPSTAHNVTLFAQPRAAAATVSVVAGRVAAAAAPPSWGVGVDSARLALLRMPMLAITTTSQDGLHSATVSVTLLREGPGAYPGSWQPGAVAAPPPGQMQPADAAHVAWGTLPAGVAPLTFQPAARAEA
jgi:hypothetical protein